MRSGKHDAGEYYNVTRRIGMESPSSEAMNRLLMVAAGMCALGIAGIVVTVLLAIRGIHSWRELPALLGYLLLGLPAGIMICVGLALLFLGGVSFSPMRQFHRAVAKETEAMAPQ